MITKSIDLSQLRDSKSLSTVRSDSHNKFKKNISLEILRKRQLGIDDPLSNVGIMSLNNQSLPYKKPILKQYPGIYVNTKGVIDELNRDFGGLNELRSSSSLINPTQK
jgi:hypothetical protein